VHPSSILPCAARKGGGKSKSKSKSISRSKIKIKIKIKMDPSLRWDDGWGSHDHVQQCRR